MIGPADVLVLMACSGVKTGGGEKPLIELYAGPLWLTLKTHIGAIPPRNVFVLSAKLGFQQAALCAPTPTTPGSAPRRPSG